MGTTWHATVVVPPGSALDEEALTNGIAQSLQAVNGDMSTYIDSSEISRFNRSPVNEWFPLSPEFVHVLATALQIGRYSGGAYDVTVGPLVNLWGFGPTGSVDEPPTPEEIAAASRRVGQDKLEFDAAGSRLMKHADVYLDFSSIAKGYAADVAGGWLEGQGITDYLVEIGGEMRLSGTSPRGDAWRVAIEQPEAGRFGVARAILPGNAGVATSGDYRNFFERDGVRYSHSIDPRTGYPVAHELVSVTVVNPSAMVADAWATALTVLGPDAAWSVAQDRELAVYFIQRDGDGFSSRYTERFQPYLAAPDPQ